MLNPSKEVRDKLSKSLIGNTRALGLKMMSYEGFRLAQIGNKRGIGNLGKIRSQKDKDCLLKYANVSSHFNKVHCISDYLEAKKQLEGNDIVRAIQ